MPLLHTYADAYLKAQVTEDRETRAVADVAALGTFTAPWPAKLAVLRAYVIACLECQAQPDDLFAQKLKHYRQEFESALAMAKAASPAADGMPRAIFSMEIARA